MIAIPVIQAQYQKDRKDGVRKLMIYCASRAGRHPIHICRYCQFFKGVVFGGVNCDWHITDGEVTFKTEEDRLPKIGDTSIISDLFDGSEDGSTLV